jgi:uncharacterized protein (DUF983 family)
MMDFGNEQSHPKDPLAHKNSIDEDCHLEAGHTCPACHQGILDYNGLLNLVCPYCGKEWNSSFT